MERPFDIQIEKLKTKMFKMASLVDEQVENAIKTLENNDKALATEVIERDALVDDYDIKIDRICHKIFALNQPVAMDLRLIISALKINANLERMGDLAVKIAYIGKEMAARPDFYDSLDINEIARISREMIKKAIDSFITQDTELAKNVTITDSKLDRIVKENIQNLTGIMKQNPDNIESGLQLVNILRELERLGDHASNIGEEVYFIVKARNIRHST